MEKQTREFAAKVYGREWLPPICWLSLPPLFSLYLRPRHLLFRLRLLLTRARAHRLRALVRMCIYGEAYCDDMITRVSVLMMLRQSIVILHDRDLLPRCNDVLRHVLVVSHSHICPS